MAEKKNVRIRLFKDNSRYKGDLFVSVNGVNYKIRRGVEVEVPPALRRQRTPPSKPETDKKPGWGACPAGPL